MTKTNPVFALLGLFGDNLTAYQLAYKDTHQQGDETRFQAAARIASTKGGVILWDDYGYATVMSDDPKRPEPYEVCYLVGETFCPCHDGTYSKHNKSGYCKHLLSSMMVGTLQAV